MRKLELQGDRYGILAAMFMQDGPFLILRLYLIITYDFFVDPKFLFYIGKNIISLLLMIYRLYVIHFPAEEKEMVIEKPKLFRSLSFVLIGAQRFKSAAAKKLGNKERRFSQKGRRQKKTSKPCSGTKTVHMTNTSLTIYACIEAKRAQRTPVRHCRQITGIRAKGLFSVYRA